MVDPVALAWLEAPVDHAKLFHTLFSATALEAAYKAEFISTTGKGIDRLNGFQFRLNAKGALTTASEKCLSGQFRFSPFLEVLRTKGRDKPPRLIGIPTVRDRVVLHQLNKFLAAVYPERVPKNVASTYVRALSKDLKACSPKETWICSTDIRTFYDSIQRDRLLRVLAKRIKCAIAIKLIGHALSTPTVPKNTRRTKHKDYKTTVGVPQGIAISNILASIYMQEVDEAMQTLGVTYYRYVDDVLMYGNQEKINKAYSSLKSRLKLRGLNLHSLASGKTHIHPLSESFSYLGYTFLWPTISVRDVTTERFLQSIASKFSDYTHNKARRLEKYKYLSAERLREIFLLELNERITGAISAKKRYGWVAYFNEISDLKLLHRLDGAIAGLFKRLPDFGGEPPIGLKKLRRAYFEMKFNPQGGYVRDYDRIKSPIEMLKLLEERGRVGPEESLNDDQIRERYEKYLHYVLVAMHKDEGVLYG